MTHICSKYTKNKLKELIRDQPKPSQSNHVQTLHEVESEY